MNRYFFINFIFCKFFLFCSLLQAKTVSVTIIGAPDEEVHDSLIFKTEQVQKKLNHQSYIALGEYVDGTPFKKSSMEVLKSGLLRGNKVAKKIQILKIKTKQDIENVFKMVATDLKKGDVVNLNINNHGNAPSSKKHPLSSTIALDIHLQDKFPYISVGEMSMFELKQLIKKYFSNHQVQIVSSQCYSGSAHEISFEEENICSISSTDYRSTSYTKGGHDMFAEGVLSALTDHSYDFNKDNQTSLFEAYLSAIFNDFSGNKGRGSLSSDAFLSKKLSLDAYNLNNYEFQLKNFIDLLYIVLEPLPTVSPLEYTAFAYEKSNDCPFKLLGFEVIDQLSSGIQYIENNLASSHSLSSKVIPAEILQILKIFRSKWNQSDLMTRAKSSREDYIILKKKWDRLDIYEKSKKNAEFRAKFRMLEESTRTDLAEIISFYKMFNYENKIKLFLQSSPTKNDIEKLIQLMNCELRPMI